MKSPKITVLLSVYNGERHLKECLDSILSQTFKDFEFVIYEHGSTDSTREIVKDYEKRDKRIRVVYIDENDGLEGMFRNVNEGMRNARGEYIARIDADDIALPERFEHQVVYMDEYPDVFILGTGAENVSEEGEHISYFNPPVGPAKVLNILSSRNCIYHPSLLIRKNEVLKYRLPYAEDYDLYLQALNHGFEVDNLPEILIKYRLTKDSVSRGDIVKTQAMALMAQHIYLGKIQFEDIDLKEVIKRYDLDYGNKNDLKELALLSYRAKDYEAFDVLSSGFRKRFGVFNTVSPLWIFTLLKRAIYPFLRR